MKTERGRHPLARFGGRPPDLGPPARCVCKPGCLCPFRCVRWHRQGQHRSCLAVLRSALSPASRGPCPAAASERQRPRAHEWGVGGRAFVQRGGGSGLSLGTVFRRPWRGDEDALRWAACVSRELPSRRHRSPPPRGERSCHSWKSPSSCSVPNPPLPVAPVAVRRRQQDCCVFVPCEPRTQTSMKLLCGSTADSLLGQLLAPVLSKRLS